MEFKGYTYGFDGKHGQYRSEEGIKSQKLLFETGVNWMCLAFFNLQETASSYDIGFNYGKSVTDRDIIAAVKHAHDNNVKVCLKPMVNCADEIWRARISFPEVGATSMEEDIYWKKWFDNYDTYILYYAELAEETGCEMLCIGCEMCATEHKELFWRNLITKVREVYSGKIIYNTNHGSEHKINWFDAVDYIGTSAYFPVAFNDFTKEEMIPNWEKISTDLEELSKKWNKKIVFIEIGCRSAHSCSSMPWDFEHKELPHDEDEQAAFFDSCLTVFSKKEWFEGFFWWDWSTYIYDDEESAHKCNHFNIHLKKAEKVIKTWYKEKLN